MKKTRRFFIVFAIFLIFSSFFAINVSAEENETVRLGGTPFGIKMFSDGVMVVKTESVDNNGVKKCPAEKAGIKPNDIIVSANETKIKTNEELAQIIENSRGNAINLEIKRNDDIFSVTLTPVKNSEGVYKAGLWVKDSAAGIGTVTFYSEELKSFCALGHGICESDTGMLIPLDYGKVEKANIASVTKSKDGKVGSLNGYFTREEIGTATINSSEGIYGITEYCTGEEIEVAEINEIKTGEASIYTTISGQKPEYYEAEIIKVSKNNSHSDLIIKITDEELLNETGGIVQGMSGSPIIQNGKLVGAVTHVIVDDVDCGYGIFAQRMLNILKENCN